MFNNVSVSYDERKDVYTVSGFFGSNFKRTILKILGKKKASALFIDYSLTGFSFYSFFTLEVYRVLETLTSANSKYSVDVKSISNFLKYVDENIWDDSHIKTHLDRDIIKEKMIFKILPHQEPAFDRYEIYKDKLGYRGLLFDMAAGSGKTYASLALTEALHSDKVIMIVPNQTIDKVWIHSLQEELYKEPQAVFLLQDNKSYGGEKFILVNYESLEKLEEFIKENNLKGASVIVDESHNFANAISKRTKKLTNVLDAIEAENILMMSGTPVKAYSRELGVIMKILDTRFNSVIEKRFITLYKTPNFIFKQILPERFGEYSVKVKKEKLEQPVTRYIKIKLKNGKKYTLDSIREDLRRYIEKRAEELLANFDMYKQTYEELYQKAKSIAMLDGVKEKEFRIYEEDFQAVIKLYNQNKLAFHPDIVKRVNAFEKEILLPRLSGVDKKDFREAKTVVKYLLLKLQGEALANVVMRARIECHKDIASNLSYSKVVNSTTKKTIIFSNYIDVCEAGKNKLQKEKFTPVTVYGNTSKNLSETVGVFNKDPLANPLVTTYKSLSTGVPLITANVVLALDLPFRMYIYEQAIARVWRLGQDKQVIVYIPELDTGDELNINGRNLDIITFYKEEVERITGHKLDIDIESDDTISNEDFKHLIEGKIYVPKTVKRRFFNVLTDW